LGIAIVGHDAASPYRRRQAVCRLRRRHGAGDRRPAYRPGPSGADFRRRHGRLQLHPSLRWGRLYAEASWTQALADWIGAHTGAFAALGGVPKLLVPDNTKVAVIKACLYEPQVNRTYAEMAAHYDTAILPARPRRPRDKAKVEVAVLIIERWLLGRLRHRRFYSLAELNTAISELLRQLNDERPIRRLGVTRRALFEELDRPNLNSLPAQPYCFAEWRVPHGSSPWAEGPRVGVDYHVELEGHFYSVPYRFARSEVEVRLTPRAVEIFLKGERIAAHLRASGNHRHTTVCEHMPSSHRRYADWTVERIRREAASIGPATAALCELILERRPHPEQGFRACLGIVRLVRPFGADRLEAAATRAIEIGTLTYGSVRSILDNKLDRQAAQPSPVNGVPILHPNIRGPRYYH